MGLWGAEPQDTRHFPTSLGSGSSWGLSAPGIPPTPVELPSRLEYPRGDPNLISRGSEAQARGLRSPEVEPETWHCVHVVCGRGSGGEAAEPGRGPGAAGLALPSPAPWTCPQ